MSLEKLKEIDVIGTDNESGFVTLANIDDWPWGDEEQFGISRFNQNSSIAD